MSDCRFGVSPVNYPDPDPEPSPVCVKVLHGRLARFLVAQDSYDKVSDIA